MKTKRDLHRVVVALSSVALLCGGCTADDVGPEEPLTDQNASNVELNNSAYLNGAGENGAGENGTFVGSSFNLAKVTGAKIGNFQLNATLTKALVSQSLLKNGPVPFGFLGMEIKGEFENGDPVTLRLDEAEAFNSVAGKALYRYTISFTVPGSSARAYVCGKSNGTPVKTIPLTGRWNYDRGVKDGGSKIENPNAITFACQGFALYKCVDLGYHPWVSNSKKDKKKASQEDYHQACTRMIRADYCGDGQPWTVDGTLINIYDNIGIQKDEESWPVEAEWNTEGARCLSHQRIQNMSEVPQCSFQRTAAKCGNPPEWSKTLLVSEAK